jgi:hypothetical protein
MHGSVSEYPVQALSSATWDAFARFAQRHNGVFGGCWCTWFHTLQADKTFTADGNRALKRRLVADGRAHAALVFDGVTRRWPGVSTACRRNCRTSTTAGGDCPQSPSAVPST